MIGTAGRALATAVATVLLGGVVATGASAGVWEPAGGDDLTLGTSSAAAEASDFYRPRTPLKPGAPGTVIRSRAIPAPEGARAWRVLYHSRDIDGNDIAVSGVVVAPVGDRPRGGRPVVAWAHATTGIGDACAPSRGPNPGADILWIGDLLEAGYVVAATDYEGLGTDGVHPYLVGASEGRSVLDSIRAARNLPTGANRKAAVYGHSQGGHSALFAGELATEYAPELSLRAVAAGAPVAAPAEFIDHTVAAHDTVGFLVMGALGYQAAYPELAATPLLTEASAQRADVAVRGCAPEVVQEFADADPEIVFGVDPRTVTAWVQRLEENAAGRRRSAAPVLYWQGDADDLTEVALADAYADRACANGTVLDYRVYRGADHVTVVDAARDDVLDFLADRLSGKRPTRTCPAEAAR